MKFEVLDGVLGTDLDGVLEADSVGVLLPGFSSLSPGGKAPVGRSISRHDHFSS